jgi:regulator of protease activity HflC (stomatin/prohibitin superfamily)
MNPTLITALISAALSGVGGFALAWRLQTATITQMELESANERISLQRTARATLERSIAQAAGAQRGAADRATNIRRAAAAAVAELDGLRVQSAATLRAAASNLDACLIDATAKTELLTQCATRYTDVAAAADGHASDIKTLTEAWPR